MNSADQKSARQEAAAEQLGGRSKGRAEQQPAHEDQFSRRQETARRRPPSTAGHRDAVATPEQRKNGNP